MSCLTIAFLALAALFTYLSRVSKNSVHNRDTQDNNAPYQNMHGHIAGKNRTPPTSTQRPSESVPSTNQQPEPPKPTHSEQLTHLEGEKKQLEEELKAHKTKYEALFEEHGNAQKEAEATQDQIASLQKTVKSLYNTYQNLLSRYEETQRAHLFELKTLFKKTTPGTLPEVSSLFTFHRQLRSPEEQLYFLASLMDKDASKEGGSMISSLQALDVRRRLKVLDMYHDIPWMLLNPKTSEIDGSSKSCPKHTHNQLNLIKKPLQVSPYELFQIELGDISCIGVMLDQSQTHALLVVNKPTL